MAKRSDPHAIGSIDPLESHLEAIVINLAHTAVIDRRLPHWHCFGPQLLVF
jgi:hypothetical protein